MLTFSLKNSFDLYNKLKIDYKTLDSLVNSYSAFNFVITAYHLLEWIKNDNITKNKIGKKYDYIEKMSEYKICGDIANSSKHFKLTRREPITANTEVETGFGVGRFGKGLYGKGEETINIILRNGKTINILSLANKLMSAYDKYFSS